jgi:hypothetical protein
MGDMPEILYNLLAKGKAVLWSSQDKHSCKVSCIWMFCFLQNNYLFICLFHNSISFYVFCEISFYMPFLLQKSPTFMCRGFCPADPLGAGFNINWDTVNLTKLLKDLLKLVGIFTTLIKVIK